MNMDQLKQAVSDVAPAGASEACELIEGAALEACSGGKFPWVKWGMAFNSEPTDPV